MPKKKKNTNTVAPEPNPVSQGQLEHLLALRTSIDSNARYINQLPIDMALLFPPIRMLIKFCVLLLAEVILTPAFYGIDKLIEEENNYYQYSDEDYNEIKDFAYFIKAAFGIIVFLPIIIILDRWVNSYIHNKIHNHFSAGILLPSQRLNSEASILSITTEKEANELESKLSLINDSNKRFERYIAYGSRLLFLYNVSNRIASRYDTSFSTSGHGLTTFSLVSMYKDFKWHVSRFNQKRYLHKVENFLKELLSDNIDLIIDVEEYKKIHIATKRKKKFNIAIGVLQKEVTAQELINALNAACLLSNVEVITFNKSAIIIDSTNKAILSATFRAHYDTSLQCIVAKREEQYRLQEAANAAKEAQASNQRLQQPKSFLAPALLQPVGTTVYQRSSAQSSVTIHPVKPDLETEGQSTRHRDSFFRKNATPSTRAASSTSTPRHFPLTAPWLKEGELFARIDSRIRDIIRTDDMYHAIENHIHHGRVVGNKAKTKSGGAGIVPCQFFYKSVDGPKQAMFKVKQGNVRVFGTRVVEETAAGLKQVVVFNGVNLRAH